MQALTIAFVAAILAASVAAPQHLPERPLASFLITIETTPTEVCLTCEVGCEWEILRFPVDSIPTVIDPKGIVDDQVEDRQPAEGFVIAITADGGVGDDGMHMRCERGCAWRSADFSPKRLSWVTDECGTAPKRLWKPSHLPCAERRQERERDWR